MEQYKAAGMSACERKSGSWREYGGEASTSISTFVIKIYNLLSDPENAQAISWHADGSSFLIKDTALLTARVLPLHFRHSNYQSFIRQLNMYSFAKLKDHNVHRFRNPYFLRDHEELLKYIKRKPEKKKFRSSEQSLDQLKENDPAAHTTHTHTHQNDYPLPQEERPQQHVKIEEEEASPLAKTEEETPMVKRVRFEEDVKGGNSDENISSIIEATSKWINHKEESCWGNIKSTKSIELSMKLIANDDEEERREPSSSGLHHPIILLFNPNLTEKSIKSAHSIAQQL